MKFLSLIVAIYFFSLDVASKEIKVVTEYLSPFQIKNADGTLGGFSTQVIKEIFKLTKDKAHISVMPWARAYKIAQSEENVLIYSIARTKLREKNFNWIGSLLSENYYFWGLKERFNKAQYSIIELRQLNVATIRNTNRHEYLINSNFTNIHELIYEEQQLNMLHEHRTELILEAELTLFEIARKQKFDTNTMKKIAEIEELSAELSIAFSNNSKPQLVKKYKEAFNQLRQNGTLERLKKKWHIPLN